MIGRTIYVCFILNVSALSENWRNIHESIINHILDDLSLKRVTPLQNVSAQTLTALNPAVIWCWNDESLLSLHGEWELNIEMFCVCFQISSTCSSSSPSFLSTASIARSFPLSQHAPLWNQPINWAARAVPSETSPSASFRLDLWLHEPNHRVPLNTDSDWLHMSSF